MKIAISAALLTTALLIALPTFAGLSYTPCPGSMQYIYVGNTTQAVTAACGQPTSIRKIAHPKPRFKEQDQWVYNYQPWRKKLLPNNQIIPQSIMAVNFDDFGNITAITVNGRHVVSTNFCSPGQSISAGSDSSTTVMSICGPPNIRQTVKTLADKQPQNVTVWTYSGKNLSPSLQLTFTDSVLSSIEQL